MIMSKIRHRRIRIKFSKPERSILEGVFARGDRRLGKVILQAWQDGCRFDAWDDFFDYDKWVSAFEKTGFDEKSYLYRERGEDEILPWDHVSSGIIKEFLVSERKKSFEQEFTVMVQKQNSFYHEMFETLKNHVFKKYSVLAENQKNHNMLEGWAKEDARYITSLATEGQLGMTINARNLEFLFRRFASHPLKEIQAIGSTMFGLVKDVSPSIILFTDPNDYDTKVFPDLQKYFQDKPSKGSFSEIEEVSLYQYTPNADELLVASLMHHATGSGFSKCMEKVKTMSKTQKKEAIKVTFQHMEFFNSPLREFEFLNLLFEVTLSASCFAQLKRHRMSTIVTQEYDPNLRLTIPESVKETGFEEKFREVAKQSEELYEKIKGVSPQAAPYILTNAHRRRVLFGVNARELYHISRLREDPHAQWDIQNITVKMTKLAEKAMPLAMMTIGSKEIYPKKYKELFGKDPKFTEIPR